MPNSRVLLDLELGNFRFNKDYAYLLDGKNNTLYRFLYNPENKSFSRQAKYIEGVTSLSSTPSQQYGYTSGLTLQLNNLILETWTVGKVCDPLLKQLQELMVAEPSKGKYSPTPVTFVWGEDRFGPAVITNLSWVETSWISGKVASARVNITLLEVPLTSSNRPFYVPERFRDITPILKRNTVIGQGPGTKVQVDLTDRQQQEAIKKGTQWLESNIKKLPENIASLVRVKGSSTYRVLVSRTGEVTMQNIKGEFLGTIGRYSDGKLSTENNTLIKSK